MNTLITRVYWMFASLLSLAGVVFLVIFWHTANVVQSAVSTGLATAAITSDTNAIQSAVSQNIQAALPVSGDLFNPYSDISITKTQQNQEVIVTVTYHLPVLGPIQNIFGWSPTLTITRGGTQALDYPHNGLQAVLATTPPGKIAVNNVTLQASGQQLTLDIQGYGFSSAPTGVPGTTMGDFLTFADTTQGWEAGPNISGLAITYGAWQNNQIMINGIQDYGKGTEVIRPGDNCQVTLNTINGSTTYYFVASPSGTTQFHVTLGWVNGEGNLQNSATSVPTKTAVTLSASTSVPGDNTNGVGLYNATTGQYLMWSSTGDTVMNLVNSGTPTTNSYVAYYGPKDAISQALATSNDVSVTWTGGNQQITAVLFPTANGGQYINLYGSGLIGSTVSGTGLSDLTQISSNEIQVQAASDQDTSGVVTLDNGDQIPFVAEPY